MYLCGYLLHTEVQRGESTATKKRLVQLSEDLELAIIHAILRGVAASDVVDPAEVSKPGKAVLQAIANLEEQGGKPPWNYNSVFLTAVDIDGAPREAVKQYLAAAQNTGAGSDVKDILSKVRDKQLLVELINEAGSMLQKGNLDVALINGLLQREKADQAIESVSDRLADGLPPPPQGLGFSSLPVIARATGGLIGMWAIAGEPGVGKSTLAWQLCMDIGRHTKVLVYDFENGFPFLVERTSHIFRGDLGRIRAATANIYVRDSIRTLESDLGSVPPPALVVVDSVQKLPGSIEHRRTSLDRWVHRLEGLKKRGYSVLLVSEVGRANYERDAYIGAFKETGEIEYSVDLGLQLLPGSGDCVEAHIVKNRHRPNKGYIATLERTNGWRYREMSSVSNQGENLD